jgi:hypothetical protein
MHGGPVLERKHLLAVLLQKAEKRLVIDDAVFHDLAQSGGNFPLRQAFHEVQIDEYRIRLVKAADEVLAQRMIDGHLAADTGVDLREQACRHLHERDAAHIGCGHEAGEIADHASAQREDRRPAVQPLLDDVGIDPLGLRHAFRAFPRRDLKEARCKPRLLQCRRNGPAIKRPDVRIAHHQTFPGISLLADERLEPAAELSADEDIIAVLPEFHTDHAVLCFLPLIHGEAPFRVKNE